MKLTWNNREKKVMKIPVPNPKTHVDLIVRPVQLKRHVIYVMSQVDVTDLPFLVAKHYLPEPKKFCYVHRQIGTISEVKRLNPPK